MVASAAAVILTFAVLVAVRNDSSNGNIQANHPSCVEAKTGLAQRRTRPFTEQANGSDYSGDRQDEKDRAGDGEALVEAVASCAAHRLAPDLSFTLVTSFFAAVGAGTGVLSLLLAGMRYDVALAHLTRDGGSSFDITVERGDRRGRWKIRNVGLGPEMIIGVMATRFAENRRVSLDQASFERFPEPRRLKVGKSALVETTFRGDDLLLALLSENAGGFQCASWVRVRRIDENSRYEKYEEGKFFKI